jgi:hypothetical protein
MRNIEVNETGNFTSDTSQNYCATFEDYDNAPNSGHQCIGMGRTPREAVIHLKDCCQSDKRTRVSIKYPSRI